MVSTFYAPWVTVNVLSMEKNNHVKDNLKYGCMVVKEPNENLSHQCHTNFTLTCYSNDDQPILRPNFPQI